MHTLKTPAILFTALLTAGAWTRGAAAQDAPATTQPAPAAPADTPPATAPTTQPAVRASSKISLNFKDAPIDTVLTYLSEAAGFVVVKETAVDGRVTVLSKQPINREEAVTLLNTVLKSNGYTAIQMGRILKVVSRDKAKKGNLPVYFGADPEKIAATDELITQVIPVGSVDAVKLRTDLTPLLNTDADVAANAGANAIIVTDSSINIRRIVEIIAALDQHRTAVSDIKIFPLKYASAPTVAKLITDIFKPPTAAAGTVQPQGGFQRFFRQGGPGAPGAAAAADTGGSLGGQVLASSDDRTNTLVVTGPTDTLKVIERIVKELDSDPSESQSFFIYKLKNGQSQNLAAVLNTLFGANTSSSSVSRPTSSVGSGSPSSAFGAGNSSRSTASSGLGSASATGARSTTGFGSSASTNNTGNRAIGGTPAISAAMTGIANEMSGQVYVVAEPDTNSLLVTTNAKFTTRVKGILDELDRAVPQVLIKVLIAEVTHENGSDIGVEYAFNNKHPNGHGEAGGSDFGVASAITNALAAGGPNGFVFSMVESNATATIRALATTGKLDVLSRPYILASDNQLASIMVGQEVPFITDSRLTDTGQTINTIQYQDVGIILNVTPHINPEGLVTLDVAPEISQLTDSVVPIQAGVNAPIFNRRFAQSRVSIKNGETIVIGGLMQDEKQENVDKIPILGDIPILGEIFRHTKENKSKTELLIFLTPHVAQQPDVLKTMSREEKEGTKLVPHAVAPGVYDEHMKGLRRGATTRPAPEETPKPGRRHVPPEPEDEKID